MMINEKKSTAYVGKFNTTNSKEVYSDENHKNYIREDYVRILVGGFITRVHKNEITQVLKEAREEHQWVEILS